MIKERDDEKWLSNSEIVSVILFPSPRARPEIYKEASQTPYGRRKISGPIQHAFDVHG